LRYGNPLPPEGINTTPTHPLKEFALLTGGLIGLLVAFVLIVGLLADRFAHYIPFETEVSIAQSLVPKMGSKEGEVQAWLQKLADELAAAQGVPGDISVTVHYVNSDTVNAMASLGGHIVMFRGLMQRLESENAIAMVLAHEIAHIHHRHPIQTLGRGAVVSIALAALGISTGDAGRILGSAGLLTELTFSRHQEQQSDDTALQSLYRHYGHVGGAGDLFEMFMKEEPASVPRITFFSTHPLSEKRIDNIREYARQKGWPLSGPLLEVPASIRRLIDADAESTTPKRPKKVDSDRKKIDTQKTETAI